MVDSRDKGVRAEYTVRDLLRDATGVEWERVPGSGGFGSQHGLKGDIYLPNSTGLMSRYCIEVKHYKDEHFNSNIIKPTATKSQFEKWLAQTEREAGEMNAKPMIVFKKDRGNWFVGVPLGDTILDYIEDIVVPYAIVHVSVDVDPYHIVDFKEFLKVVPLDELAK